MTPSGKLLYILPALPQTKPTKQGPHSHTKVQQVYFPSTNYSSRVLLGQDVNKKEISIFQNPFNCVMRSSYLQMEVTNLQDNEMLKSKYQENSTNAFQEMNMLKIICTWIDINIWQKLCVKRYFQR